jgi:NAD(P)-dependent dehydrogenase (short-subunit alcohol dehydrogenase family)
VQDRAVALVTGANKGIGRQIAQDLAAHGFTVLVGSRNLEHGETAAKNARSAPLVRRHESGLLAPAAERIRNTRRDASSTCRAPPDRSHGTRT